MLRTCLALVLLTFATTAHAQDRAEPARILAAFGKAFIGGADKFKDTERLIEALTATGEPTAARPLRTLSDGRLKVRADGAIFETGAGSALRDPVTGEIVGDAEGRLKKVRVKNSLRRLIAGALSGLTLRAKSRTVRLRSAATIFRQGDASAIEPLDAVLETEADVEVRAAFLSARASAVLNADRPEAESLTAIETLQTRGDRAARNRLANYATSAPEPMANAARAAIRAIDAELALWGVGQNVWYGLSLGSVLFLAAIGLAITFGVMGVINMAHGEMVMLGAYTTFAVQEAVRGTPLFEWSLLIALPLAFLASGSVGLAMERGIIRFLYGRPLETLLATWGVSLILQQAVRTIFGPNNREVGNPDFMSGAFKLGELAITWNRLWILLFSLGVFAVLLGVLRRTQFGLHMRAVTQNRPMAASMGIRTGWVDAFTFALGSGIAGIAGVALSQIDNVSPNLGQSYIIDSFLVVVFGGVGNLWGALVGAFGLGIANKFLEPYAGAVLAKILVLVAIILFIQKRPRGLFALKGRAVEA